MVSWKDSSSNWVLNKDIKDGAYPVHIAEYAVANKIANKPAFNWWVHTLLRKRNRIVAKVAIGVQLINLAHKFQRLSKKPWQLTKKQGLTSGARHWVTNWDMV